jgi:glycolate oxidase
MMEAAADTSENFQGTIVQKLEAAIGAENVKTSKMERLLYGHDSTNMPKEVQLGFKTIPDIVVRPRSTKDVQNIVKIAAKEGVPVTPRGAASWYLSGAVTAYGGILIDMVGGMNKILNIDEVNMTITCQAGASWKQVYDAAWEKGFLLGAYPSSFPSASIAGWISTAGVGIGCYKYGNAGDIIRNMVVVTPSGDLINTGFDKLFDASSGYNLNRLFVGTEGTLGVICEVTFKLVPRPEVLKPLAYSFEGVEKLGDPIREITRSRIQPLHISWSDRNYFKWLQKIGHGGPDVGVLLLVTVEGDKTVTDYEEKVVDAIAAKYGGKRESDELAMHEWNERCYEQRGGELGLGVMASEVLVPTSEYAVTAHELYDLIASMKMEAGLIGIMCDRNTVMFMPMFLYDKESLTKSMVSFAFAYKAGEVAKKHGGRLLGGFGMLMSSQLQPLRGEAYYVMTAIKSTLDPQEIMNPGKLLGMKTRFGLPVGPGLLGFGMGAMSTVKKLMPGDQSVAEQKAESFHYEELEKEKLEQHKHDPLKQKK